MKIRVEGILPDVLRVLSKLRGESVEVFIESNTHAHTSTTITKKAKKAKVSIVTPLLPTPAESKLERKRRLDRDRKRKERAGLPTKELNRNELNAHGKPLKGGPGSYWAKMTPKQRSEEMAHRAAVRMGKAQARPRQYNSGNFPMGGVA